MSKSKLIIAGTLLILMIGGFLLYNKVTGPTIPAQSAENLELIMGKHNKVVFPKNAEAPFPVVLMFHGCGGTHKGSQLWANRFASQGYAAVIIDSLTPRDITHEQAMDTVCSGQLLRGDERSADIWVMLNWLRKQRWADSDNVILAGWSHGAWSILDLLSRDLTKDIPISLTEGPTSQAGVPLTLKGVKGTLLFYPYCGRFSRATANGLHKKPDSLLLLGAQDTVISSDECTSFAAAEAAKGWQVSTQIFPDAGHSFDVPMWNEEEPNKNYNVKASIDTARLVRSFLAAHRH